jgi:hypothetical protein
MTLANECLQEYNYFFRLQIIMVDNTSLPDGLLSQNIIRLCDSELLHIPPPSLPSDLDFMKEF